MTDYRDKLIIDNLNPVHGSIQIGRLIKIFRPKKIAEVGVCAGITAAWILSDYHKLTHYYMIDHWKDVKKYNLIKHNFKEKCVRIIHKDSMAALGDIKDGSLDMLYLDTLHGYEQTKRETPPWYAKVRPGGIFVGDGYGYKVEGDDGCRRAVREIFAPRRINVNLGPDYIYWVVKSV